MFQHPKSYEAITTNKVGVFCYLCGKDNFDGNHKSLSSHVRFCKQTAKLHQSGTQANRKCNHEGNQEDCHNSGTTSFPFLVKRRTHENNSLHMVLPKTNEGGVTKVIPPSKNPAHHNYMMGSPNDPNEEESSQFDNLFPNTLTTDSSFDNTDLLLIINPSV